MVYKRFVNKWGPYKYRSERHGDTVLSIYLGRATEEPKNDKPPAPVQRLETMQPPEPQRKPLRIEKKRRGQTKLKHFERMHLYAFCKKFQIDRAEIDHGLTYDENREILEKYARQNGYSREEITGQDLEGRYWADEYKRAKKQLKEENTASAEDLDAWESYNAAYTTKPKKRQSDSVQYNPNEKSSAQINQDAEDHKKTVNSRIKKECRDAKSRGATVPYSYGTMLDAGVPIDTIRKVYRQGAD